MSDSRSSARQARFLTLASLRWLIRQRAYFPYHLRRYWRFFWFRLRNPHVVCQGLVFLGKDVTVYARPGYGRVVLGRFTHLGDGCRIYAHEGTVRIGAKTVLGRQVTVTSYLDIDIGASCLLADWTYITDFDHELTDIGRPIKDQGLAKAPVRISDNCWLGVRTTALRGSRVGHGTAVGAHSVIRGELAELAVAVGVPARVVKDRRVIHSGEQERREYLAGLARGALEDTAAAAGGAADGSSDDTSRGSAQGGKPATGEDSACSGA